MRAQLLLSLIGSQLIACASAGLAPPPPPPCSLNGVVGAGGACVCDAGWVGADCGSLNLLPAAPLLPGVQVYLNKSDNSWGISVLPDDNGLLLHGFMTELANGCALAEYGYASRIVHAIAEAPGGPWTILDVALASFAHNPQAVRDLDGSWLLFHIGAPLPPYCNMSCDPAPHMNASCSKPVSHGTSVARAPTPYGPWEIVNWILPKNETNPSALVLPNGTIVLTARRWVSGVPIYTAPSWRGPYTLLPLAAVIPVPYANSSVAFDEDPYLYAGPRGSWHILTHRQPSGTNCPAQGPTPDDCRCGGGHMYSENLLGPWFLDLKLVFNCTLAVQGAGAPVQLHARQRPTLLQRWPQPASCATLFTGASTDPVSQYYSSFTLGQAVEC